MTDERTAMRTAAGLSNNFTGNALLGHRQIVREWLIEHRSEHPTDMQIDQLLVKLGR